MAGDQNRLHRPRPLATAPNQTPNPKDDQLTLRGIGSSRAETDRRAPSSDGGRLTSDRNIEGCTKYLTATGTSTAMHNDAQQRTLFMIQRLQRSSSHAYFIKLVSGIRSRQAQSIPRIES